MSKHLFELAQIETVSGTAHDPDGTWRGFVTVRAIAKDGSIMSGQLSLAECRQMALRFLETAAGGDQDAIVFRVMTRDLDLPAEVVARVVMAMREERDDGVG